MLWALLTFEKYEPTNYDVCGMKRYSQNILQWNKNDMISTKATTGEFSLFEQKNPYCKSLGKKVRLIQNNSFSFDACKNELILL